MHAFLVIFVLLAVCHGVVSLQEQQDDVGNTTALPNDIMTAINKVVFEKCKTGFGDQGECVERKYCNYGTEFIDFTTYAPKGYIKPCKEEEVCCPIDAQIPILPKKKIDEESFDFEEDD